MLWHCEILSTKLSAESIIVHDVHVLRWRVPASFVHKTFQYTFPIYARKYARCRDAWYQNTTCIVYIFMQIFSLDYYWIDNEQTFSTVSYLKISSRQIQATSRLFIGQTTSLWCLFLLILFPHFSKAALREFPRKM